MGAFFHSKNSTTPLKRSLLCHVTYLPVLDILLYKTQIDHSLVISHPICMKLDSKKRENSGLLPKITNTCQYHQKSMLITNSRSVSTCVCYS